MAIDVKKQELLSEIVPTREEIKKYGTKHANPVKDKEIHEEANKRFWATFRFLDCNDELVKTKTVGDLEDKREAVHYELQDQNVQEFLQQATALKIKNNRDLDNVTVENNFDETKREQTEREQELIYLREAEELYQNLLEGPYQKRLSQILELYPELEDNDDLEGIPAKIIREYYELSESAMFHEMSIENGFLQDINVDSYIAVATTIGDQCANNSYLEELFLTFLPKNEREESLTPIVAERNIANEKLVEKLRVVEQQARAHIKMIYGTELPLVSYVDKRNSRSPLGNLAASMLNPKSESTIQEAGNFAFTTDIDGNPSAIKQLEVTYDVNNPFILNAAIVFEELYHASGFPLQKQQSERYWPGWHDDGSGSLFEEGLAAFETDIFLEQYYYDEYRVPDSPHEIAKKALQGEKVNGVISDIWPEVFMRQLILQMGRNFLRDLRKARAQGDEKINVIEKQIDDLFGDETYYFLSQVDGHDRDHIIRAIRKIK